MRSKVLNQITVLSVDKKKEIKRPKKYYIYILFFITVLRVLSGIYIAQKRKSGFTRSDGIPL